MSQQKPLPEQIKNLVKSIQNGFGSRSVMLLGDKPDVIEDIYDVISTGCPSLDDVIGIGGMPKGRSVEIYGMEGVGKTTLALQLIANCQADGGVAAFIDMEHAVDLYYAADLGVKIDELIFSQPDYGEQAVEIARALIISGLMDIVVIDSTTALVPKVEIEGNITDAHMGAHPRLVSSLYRVLTPYCGQHNTLLVNINQIRHKIGVFFGSPEFVSGGNAPKFYPSVRIDMRIKEHKEEQGYNIIKFKVVKNKVGGRPHEITESMIEFGKGFNKGYDALKLGLEYGLIKATGSWYYFGEISLGNGKKQAAEALNQASMFKCFWEAYDAID